ncbi:unnamed protein product, partial [Brenthis ino]
MNNISEEEHQRKVYKDEELKKTKPTWPRNADDIIQKDYHQALRKASAIYNERKENEPKQANMITIKKESADQATLIDQSESDYF